MDYCLCSFCQEKGINDHINVHKNSQNNEDKSMIKYIEKRQNIKELSIKNILN
jgi:hypothetical protein